jgi:hypothetical protein
MYLLSNQTQAKANAFPQQEPVSFGIAPVHPFGRGAIGFWNILTVKPISETLLSPT